MWYVDMCARARTVFNQVNSKGRKIVGRTDLLLNCLMYVNFRVKYQENGFKSFC